MSEYYTVKLHNSQRVKKIQNLALPWNRKHRPSHHDKQYTYRQIPKMMVKYGYDYETQNQVMQEVQTSFENKCKAYYNKARINKLGRMDKIRRKKEFNFQPKENPLARMVKLLQQKLVNPVVSKSLLSLSDYSSNMKKNKYMMDKQYQQ